MQRNWIGASEGGTIEFAVDWASRRAHRGVRHPSRHSPRCHLHDARAGAPARGCIIADDWPAETPDGWRYLDGRPDASAQWTPRDAAAAYREMTGRLSDRERTGQPDDKTGVFTGAVAVNPATGERLSVFLGDYVLMEYGEGAIMAVPAHVPAGPGFRPRVRPSRTRGGAASGEVVRRVCRTGRKSSGGLTRGVHG